MTNIQVGGAITDDERRGRLFAGDLFVQLPSPATLAFVEFTRSMVEDACGGQGCDPEPTYVDVPRLRTSAPMMQVNCSLPVYDVCEDNVIAFHPNYFDTGIANGSEHYNYYACNRDSRGFAAAQIGTDTRRQPKPLEAVADCQIRPVPPVGRTPVFAGARLHSSVPNTSARTRISVDFRTVHRRDVEGHGGAMHVDSHCTQTTLRDDLRVNGLGRLPDELTA